MHNARKTRVLLAALLVFGLPLGASAQVAGTVSVDAHAGVPLPAGTLNDLASPGGAFGAGLAWHFHPNWAVRGDVLLMKLDNGRDGNGALLSPPVDMLHFGGGIEVNFSAPLYQDLPLTFGANLGAGLTTFKPDTTYNAAHPANELPRRCFLSNNWDGEGSPPEGVETCRYFTITGGAQVGITVHRSNTVDVNLFVKGQPHLVLTDSSDMLPYADLLQVEPFDHLWVVPVTAGVRLTF